MKILNLCYPEKSDIKYKISKFPDGQQNITLAIGPYDCKFDYIDIKTRLNNFLDLEILICSVKALRQYNVKIINLSCPYFLGSRSDRKFEEGSNNYLKDVICPIINSLNFESVTVLDPHSYVLEACLNNFKSISNLELVNFAFNDIGISKRDNQVLVSPDAGASHKIYKLAEQIGYKGDIITCSKERDRDGKLTLCNIPLYEDEAIGYGDYQGKDFVIIDDICDGGQTFINIAKEIKFKLKDNKIYLIVTHGIFSKGFIDLYQYFDGIYCTDSYRDLEFEGHLKNKVKQLNIF